MRKIIKTTLSLVFIYIAFNAALFLNQRNLIYRPDPSSLNDPIQGAQLIETKTADGLALNAWFVPALQKDAPILLLFHGNAGNIRHRIHKILPFNHDGYNILLAEYRGYASNPGKPTEQGLYNDAESYYAWLNDNGYVENDIILYGESLGTGVAVEMATRYPPKALILEVPFTKLSAPAQNMYPFTPFIDVLMHDKFYSIDKIAAISAPKLFLIAAKDEVLGAQTGLDLFERANAPKTLKVFNDAKHNTIGNFSPYTDIAQFLAPINKK